MLSNQKYPIFGSAVCSVWDKGYRYGYQGSEKDISESVYTTYFRILDTRIARWFSVDPELHPEQTTYCSMDNNPIFFNDILGDDIIGTRKEKRQLRKRADWQNLNNTYGKGSGRDLKIEDKSHLNSVTNSIMTAVPQAANINGQDLNPNEFHLYYTKTETETKVFNFDNRKSGMYLQTNTSTLNKFYSPINIGNNFTRNGVTLNEYLSKNTRLNTIPIITLESIRVKNDDVNSSNPAVYSFNLNRLPWNIGAEGINENSITARYGNKFQPLLGINLLTGDSIDAQAVWTSLNGRVDECNGFVVRITVTITKRRK